MIDGQMIVAGKRIFMIMERLQCQSTRDLVNSPLFEKVVQNFWNSMIVSNSPRLDRFTNDQMYGWSAQDMWVVLRFLHDHHISEIERLLPRYSDCLAKVPELFNLIDGLYEYWIGHERFVICIPQNGSDAEKKEVRPHRTFNSTIEKLNELVRDLYRDILENLTGNHPRVYRQIAAGAEVATIAKDVQWPIPPGPLTKLAEIKFIRQVLIEPPLVIESRRFQRKGRFDVVKKNPLESATIDKSEWLCYPALVGPVKIHIFFHRNYMNLGMALGNLFELARDEDLNHPPDGVLVYGIAPEFMEDRLTCIVNDKKSGIIQGFIANVDDTDYFGYLKKTALTIHNIIMLHRGLMPLHGAMCKIEMTGDKRANVVLVGDSGTGKSETLEAFRFLSKDHLRDLNFVFDDMGSVEVKENGDVVAYGTEVGAFVRLDDLRPGYAFGNIDKSIFFNPGGTNARVVIPITDLNLVLAGTKVDFFLYANNFEEVDEDHPFLEKYKTVEEAMAVFRNGQRKAKGTTDEKGLVSTYFANPFGAPQYESVHEKVAERVFQGLFKSGTFVGQLRTRLGIPGLETQGPEEAAKALLKVIETFEARPPQPATRGDNGGFKTDSNGPIGMASWVRKSFQSMSGALAKLQRLVG